MELVVIALIVVLAIYLLWLMWRWRRLSRQKKRRSTTEPVVLQEVPDTHARGEYVDTQALPQEGDDEADDARVSLSGAARSAENVAPADFQTSPFELLIEVRQLRRQLEELQRDQAQARNDIDALRERLEEVQAASRVSPQYGEAVALARRGLDAQAIAERCGISVSEAELVRALAGVAETGD